jgi:formate hydrogenlyase subunit 3/multisubunit Na+/H+ antiporter MnhD subunit
MICLPLLAAASMVAIPKSRALAVSAATILTPLLVAAQAKDVLQNGVLKMALGGWAAPLGIQLQADGISMAMLAISALIFSVITLYAWRYFRGHESAPFFWILWMFLWAALNALFLSADLFNLYVTLELLGIAAVALVALPQQQAALSAATRYLLVSLTGSLSYLMGVALIYAAGGTLSLDMLAGTLESSPSTSAAFALMAAGLIMKSALAPLHFWLPPAHANAPAPVSAVLSALVVKASFYILLRLWLAVFHSLISPSAVELLGIMAAAAVIWGSLRALTADRLKMMVAYSTVAQIGYLFLIFPLSRLTQGSQAALQGGLYFVFSHACAKAAVFLTAGNVIHVMGHDRIARLDGVVRQMPVSMFAFGLAGVSLIGLPPSGGFIAKWLYLNAALTSGQWWWCVLILGGGLLSGAYIFRFFSTAFANREGDTPERRAPVTLEWTALGLAVCAIALGFVAQAVKPLLSIGGLIP